MKQTLTILNQLGLCNAGLLTVHYCSDVKQIVEDMIVELLDSDLQQPYLDLVNIVPPMPTQSSESLKTFSEVICSISSESRDRSEFEFMIELQMRVFRVWKNIEKPAEGNEDMVRDNCYRHAAAGIAQNKTQEWAKSSMSPLPMADISSLSKELYESLISGKYFSDEVYSIPVEMNTKGEIVLCSSELEDEWTEVFDGLGVI